MTAPRKGDITNYCAKCGGVLDSQHSPEACAARQFKLDSLRARYQTIHVVIEMDAEERETRVTAFTDIQAAREFLIKAAQRIGCEVDHADVLAGYDTAFNEDQSTVELIEGRLYTEQGSATA